MFEENKASEAEQTAKAVAEFEEELVMTDDQIRIKHLEARIAELEEFGSRHIAAVNEWQKKWERAAMLFEASLEENGVDTDDLSENDRALVEMFGIEFTEEIEVTLTITYSGSITVKKGADLDDLCLEDEPAWDVNIELNGDTVGNITLDGTEYDY